MLVYMDAWIGRVGGFLFIVAQWIYAGKQLRQSHGKLQHGHTTCNSHTTSKSPCVKGGSKGRDREDVVTYQEKDPRGQRD